MSNPIKNSKFYVRLPLLLGLAVSGGILIGANMFGGSKNMKIINNGYTKFRDILTHINQSYVDSVDTEELIDYSINKMLEKLDPHTLYIPAKDVKAANMDLQGDYEGIGIEFNIFRDTIVVIYPLPGGPSARVGLRAGDKIVSVDEEKVAGEVIKPSISKVKKWLMGKKGSRVKLGIKRSGEDDLVFYTVTRDKIPNHSVDVSYMVNEETGYVKITRFSKTTYSEFRKALIKLKSKGLKKLMLDLRGNPGGYLDKAVKIADEFISGNDKLVYTDGKGIRFDSEYRAKDKGLFEKGPIIVLIDEESASASEIVAGALQDHDRALLVGRRSFGKGLVQLPIDLSDGSELRLTISRYYTPSGRSIQKPYNSYQTDLLDRYNNGELFNRDSIKVNDSLRYKTSHGRIVYGGGGIIPDYFVPLDTGQQQYFSDLIRNNVIGEFVLDYSNTNKSKLEAYGLKNFQNSFQVDEIMMQKLIGLADKREVSFDKEAYTSTKNQIKNYVKAQIARRIWNNEGFYSVIHENDPIFGRALKLFSEAEKLEKKKFDQLAKDQ